MFGRRCPRHPAFTRSSCACYHTHTYAQLARVCAHSLLQGRGRSGASTPPHSANPAPPLSRVNAFMAGVEEGRARRASRGAQHPAGVCARGGKPPPPLQPLDRTGAAHRDAGRGHQPRCCPPCAPQTTAMVRPLAPAAARPRSSTCSACCARGTSPTRWWTARWVAERAAPERHVTRAEMSRPPLPGPPHTPTRRCLGWGFVLCAR